MMVFRGLWAYAGFIRHREDDPSFPENRAGSGRGLGRARRRAAASYPYPFQCEWLQSSHGLTSWYCLNEGKLRLEESYSDAYYD